MSGYPQQIIVRHWLNRTETTEVLCRALASSNSSVPKITKKQALKELKNELAFGGYEAYGHDWSDNFDGDADQFRDDVWELVGKWWPDLS